jgi:16S rRNA (uracil1498-N3)-methyltransferase
LENDHKKKAQARIISSSFTQPQVPQTAIAISLLKNASRLEWFLEKATELGIGRIQPLLCERTERTHFRMDRMKGVLVSALLQSRQVWLPVLEEPTILEEMDTELLVNYRTYVAHCEQGEKKMLNQTCREDAESNKMVFIGPEGDFTKEEIQWLEGRGAAPVSLGSTRLRTETAGVAAAVMLVQPV